MPLGKLKKLRSILEALDYSALLSSHGEECLSCAGERVPWLSGALRSFEDGRLDEARQLLKTIPGMLGKNLQEIHRGNQEDDVPHNEVFLHADGPELPPPVLLSLRHKAQHRRRGGGELQKQLSRVRVLEKQGRYCYDPVLPVDDLLPREKSILSIATIELQAQHGYNST